jgi:hypothetical protein
MAAGTSNAAADADSVSTLRTAAASLTRPASQPAHSTPSMPPNI